AAELEIRQLKTAATAGLSGGQDYLEDAVLPTRRVIQQFRFDVQCRFDVHLRDRISSCGDWLLGGCWPLRKISRSNFQRRLRVGGCIHFASTARCSACCPVSPNKEQAIGIGPDQYLACCDAK